MFQRIKKVKFLSADFIKDPEGVMDSWTKEQCTAFDRFIKISKERGGRFSLTTAELARVFGCAPSSACRWKKNWIELGLIEVTPCFRKLENGRRQQSANIYELSPYFSTEEGEFNMSVYFPSLKLMALSLLTVIGSLSAGTYNDKENYDRHNTRERVIKTLLLDKKISRDCGRLAMTREARFKSLDFNSFIPTWVKDIKVLNLSNAGKVRLSCYERKAIDYAVENLCKTKKFIKSPFGYFVSLCETATDNFGLSKNIDFLNSLKKTFKVSSNDEMLLSYGINKRANKPSTPVVAEAPRKLYRQETRQSSSSELPVVDMDIPDSHVKEIAPLSVLKKYAPNSYAKATQTLPPSNEQTPRDPGQVSSQPKKSDYRGSVRGSVGKPAPEFDVKALQRETKMSLSLEEAEKKITPKMDPMLKGAFMAFLKRATYVSKLDY